MREVNNQDKHEEKKEIIVNYNNISETVDVGRLQRYSKM